MTGNQIANRKQKEEERSNRVKEDLMRQEVREKRSAGKFKRMSDTLNAITSPIGHVIKHTNHPEWYSDDPQLVKDVAQVSFNTPVGNNVPGSFNKEDSGTTVPGICAIAYMPGIGTCGVDNSIADIAAKSIYAYVRHANSGSRNYEAPDLMQYLMAVGECIGFHAFMRRLYSLVTTCKSDNRYYINAMLYANGVNPDDLRNNIANFRAYINSFAVRVNALYIPKDMHIFERRKWMNESIFKDQPVKKSQEYMFVPLNFLFYDDVEGSLREYPSSSDTTLVTNTRFAPGANNTLAQIMSRGNFMINSLLASEDAGIMSGDILKAYGESGLYYFDPISEDYHIESVYDENTLMQIANSIAVGSNYTGQNAFNIMQDDKGHIYQGVPYYLPDSQSDTIIRGYGIPITYGFNTSVASTDAQWLNNNQLMLNSYKDNPSPDDIMVFTRLMVGTTFGSVGKPQSRQNRTLLTNYSTEVILDYNYITIGTDNDENFDSYGYYGMATIMDSNDRTSNSILIRLALMSRFDWHPNVYVLGNDEVFNYSQQYLGFADYANYAFINNTVLSNLHYVATLSLFGIPKLGLSVRTRK